MIWPLCERGVTPKADGGGCELCEEYGFLRVAMPGDGFAIFCPECRHETCARRIRLARGGVWRWWNWCQVCGTLHPALAGSSSIRERRRQRSLERHGQMRLL